jgi:hypothetical protein
MAELNDFYLTTIGGGYESFQTEEEPIYIVSDGGDTTIAIVVEQSNLDDYLKEEEDGTVPDETMSIKVYHSEK